MFKAVFEFLGNALGLVTAIFKRNNDADMVANKKAADISKQEDDIAALETRAAAGDKEALEELRRRASQ